MSASSHLKADMFAGVRWEPLAIKRASEVSGGSLHATSGDQVQILSQGWNRQEETHTRDSETRIWAKEQETPRHMITELIQ